jgi:hypothetical protein
VHGQFNNGFAFGDSLAGDSSFPDANSLISIRLPVVCGFEEASEDR